MAENQATLARAQELLRDGDVVYRLKQFRLRWQEDSDLTYLGKALTDAVVEIEALRVSAMAVSGTTAVREEIAKIVYDAMRWSAARAENGRPPNWVDRGNSLAQVEARRFAADITNLYALSATSETALRCTICSGTNVTDQSFGMGTSPGECPACSRAATSGLAMPSREWMRDKIADDPDIEDCGPAPAATSGSEAGGEIERLKRELREALELVDAIKGTDEEFREAVERAGFVGSTYIVHALDELVSRAELAEAKLAALAKPSSPAGEDPRWQKLREILGLDGWHDGVSVGVANPDQIITHIEHIANERARLMAASSPAGGDVLETGRALLRQLRAVMYHLNGQAYSSTLSALNAFDAALSPSTSAAEPVAMGNGLSGHSEFTPITVRARTAPAAVESAQGVKYGPYRVKWLGAGVWAGINDELPAALEGKDVWIVPVNGGSDA